MSEGGRLALSQTVVTVSTQVSRLGGRACAHPWTPPSSGPWSEVPRVPHPPRLGGHFSVGEGLLTTPLATPGHPATVAALQVPTSWDACLCLLFNELWSLRCFSVSLGIYQAVFLQPEAQALLRAPALEAG